MAYTTIKKPSDYFNTKLYTGNGSTQSITGVGFQPDWVWFKNRDLTDAPTTYDAVRGATKRLQTSSTGAESTKTNGLTAFNSDGYTAGSASAINANGSNIVAWNWLANNTTASNTDGSITSTVSANTTSGFSIVKWTGTGSNPSTVGHGLNAVPKMIISKRISGDLASWHTYHASIGNAYDIYLNGTNAKASDTTWNSTTPTSSVFTVNGANVNVSGAPYIAYCFADVTGYSKFGSYTGNGNADGTFVYTGFKPAFYIIKRTDTTGAWIIKDNKRPGYNVNGSYLVANDSVAESTGSGNVASDELSNGFKIRGTSTSLNASGGTYIYMAFAAEPLVGDNPATAR
jgi:hypothetical protein